MRLVKIALLIFIASFLALSLVFADNKVVSISDNAINISGQEYANCRGAICEYTFVISNLGAENKKVNISNVFYNQKVIPLKMERYGLIEQDVEVNNPYICNQTIDEINGTTIDIYCDNISTQTISTYDYSEIPSSKYDGLKTENQWIMLHKDSENTFKATVFLPLGQKSKFDIITDNDDGTKTTLDPWVDTNEYYINLTLLTNLYKKTIAYYPLTECSGTKIVDSVTTNQLNGTLSNSGMWDNTIYPIGGNCSIKGNGASYLATISTASKIQFNTTQQFAWDGWYRANSTTSNDIVMSTYTSGWPAGQFLDYKSATNQGFGWASQPGTTYEIANRQNQNWYYFVMQRDSTGNCQLYINAVNVLNTSSNCTGFQLQGTNNLYLLGHGAGYFSQGYISHVGIYNQSLTQTEINFRYNNGTLSDSIAYPFFTNYQFTNSKNQNENLTWNSSNIDGIQIDYDSSIINQINDTALGNNLVSGTCYNLVAGQTALNWSISANINHSKDLSRVVNYTFTDCTLNESYGRQAILDGLELSEVDGAYTAYYDKTVYTRLSNSSQYKSTFDVFVVSGNKRWAFNYEENNTAFEPMFNITPVFYVWQNYNLSAVAIKNSVQSLIDSTN